MVNSLTIGNIPEQQTKVKKRNYTPQFKANEQNTLERFPTEDSFEKKDNNTGKKFAIGTLIALGLAVAADWKFNHSKNLKKIFGQAEKAAKEDAENAGKKADETIKECKELMKSASSKTETTLEENISALNKYLEEAEKLSPIASEAEIKAAFRKAAKRAQAQKDENALIEINTIYNNIKAGAKKGTPKQLVQKTESTIKEEAAQRAKIEAEKVAKEKLKAEYTQGMDEFAKKKADELRNQWNPRFDIYTAIYNKGFKALSKGKKVFTLEDGTQKIVSKGKKQTIEYYSYDGKQIDEMHVFLPSGKLSHKVRFGQDKGCTGNLEVFNGEGKLTDHITFGTELNRCNGNRISTWNNSSKSPIDEGINSIYMDTNAIEWCAIPPAEVENGLALRKWVNL